MKTMILILISALSVFLGVTARNRELRRALAVSEMRRLLLELRRTLCFSAKPVREMFSELDIGDYKTLEPFVLRLSNHPRESFSKVWHESLDWYNENGKLFGAEEIKLLHGFGNSFGSGDLPAAIELIDMTADYFLEYERRAFDEATRLGKLKLMLPIYAGFVLCLLIV